MAYIQLVLPKNKSVQQAKLIKALGDNWDVSKLEQSLNMLIQKDEVVKCRANIFGNGRTVSLKNLSVEERNSLVSSITSDERILYVELEKCKPHY